MSISTEYNAILQTASKWPPQQRASLAHDLLELPQAAAAERQLPRPSFGRALGLGRGEGDPATDEQIKQWVHEHRMEKYGQ